MIDHVWTVLCSNCIIDKDSNNLSLIDTLEQWNMSPDVTFPVVIGNPFFLVTLWSRSNLEQPERARASVMIRAPNGQSRELPEYEIDLENYRRSRNRSGFQGFELVGPGKYLFDVVLRFDGMQELNQVVATIPLEVRVTNPERPD